MKRRPPWGAETLEAGDLQLYPDALLRDRLDDQLAMGQDGFGGRVCRTGSVVEQRAASLGRAWPQPRGVRVEA